MGYEQYKLEKTKINDGDVMDTNFSQVAQNSSEILTERLKEWSLSLPKWIHEHI